MEEPKKETMNVSTDTSTETKKTINKKLIAIVAGIAVIVCIVVAVSVIAFGGNSGEKPAEQMELTDRYMEEKDYEAAIPASYKEAAEVYIAMGEYDDAIKVLEDGYEATGSEEIRKRLEEIEELLQEMEEQEETSVQDDEEASANEVENQAGIDEEDNSSQPESGFVSWADAGLEDHVMDWQDANLEAAIRKITGIQTGDIMLSDVWEITELDLYGQDISNIDALSGLRNLQELDLGSNDISDISALSGLTNLTYLWLNNNNISDYSPVSFVIGLYY